MTKNKKIKLNINSKLSDHLIQAILIFSSVFVAFLLTDYRDSKNKSKVLKISLQHIATEMKYNHRRIEAIYNYHSNLIQEIDSIKNLPNSNWEQLYGNNLSSWQGMQIPMLRSTAYQTFLNSGINSIANFELAKSIADIYNTQSIIERLDNSFFDIATTDRKLSALPKVRHLVEIYLGILPEVILSYQYGKKNGLYEYGYNIDIKNKKLKEVVEERMLYFKTAMD